MFTYVSVLLSIFYLNLFVLQITKKNVWIVYYIILEDWRSKMDTSLMHCQVKNTFNFFFKQLWRNWKKKNKKTKQNKYYFHQRQKLNVFFEDDKSKDQMISITYKDCKIFPQRKWRKTKIDTWFSVFCFFHLLLFLGKSNNHWWIWYNWNNLAWYIWKS